MILLYHRIWLQLLEVAVVRSETHFVFCVPLYFAVVDEEIERWMKFIKANLLCLTSVVPEDYRIKFMQWVAIFIKLNSVV